MKQEVKQKKVTYHSRYSRQIARLTHRARYLCTNRSCYVYAYKQKSKTTKSNVIKEESKITPTTPITTLALSVHINWLKIPNGAIKLQSDVISTAVFTLVRYAHKNWQNQSKQTIYQAESGCVVTLAWFRRVILWIYIEMFIRFANLIVRLTRMSIYNTMEN